MVRAESDIPFAVKIEADAGADAGRREANVKFFPNLLPTTDPTSTIVILVFNRLTNQNSVFCLGHNSIHLLDRTESDIRFVVPIEADLKRSEILPILN